MENAVEKVGVLIEALPYIKEFYGKVIVVKYGGNAMIDEGLKNNVMMDIVLMKYVGIRPVLVHGGGSKITEVLNKMGKESRFIKGIRVTDRETAETAEMVLSGSVNKELVSLINKNGGKAVGISGKDGGLLKAEKYRNTGSPEDDMGFVGEIVDVDTAIINTLLSGGFIPVIASIGGGSDGEIYNINADHVAREIAIALKAEKLVFLTDVEGIYEDIENKVIKSTITIKEAMDMMERGKVSGGMIPKIESCIKALRGGVKQVHVIDGRIPHSLLLEVFTDSGIGTMFLAD